MNNTITLYKITTTKAYMMDEQGVNYSLTPWGADTIEYKGYDDGGKEYVLPEGYQIALSQSGTKEIYKDGEWCDLTIHSSGKPQILGPGYDAPVLKLAAAVMLGRKGGQATSPAKTAAARKNAQKGGRPRKYSVLALNRQGAPAPDGFVGTKAEIEDWLSIWSDPENFSLSITWITDGQEYGRKPLGETKIEWYANS